MKLFFDDEDFDGQLQRTATAAYCGSADLGEMLATVQLIKPGDGDSWWTAWSALADRLEGLAQVAEKSGHRESAAELYLRATEYWRQAFFFIRRDIDAERLQTGWRRHRAAFRAALPLLPWDSTTAELPFGAGRMTAYLLRPAGPQKPRGTIVLPAGYDSTAEAGYAGTAWMALARGWNALTWEGPGQGGMLYQYHVPMRPDFEAVLPPVVDWLLAQGGVDPARIVLLGRSFAGYLAPRAAAHEARLAALVCDPGQYDFVSRMVPGMIDQATWAKILASDAAVDAAVERMLDAPGKREWLGARMATMGAKTVGDFLRMQPLYTLDGHAELIKCPTLVVDCEGDFASQGDRLYAALRCEKKLLRLTAAEGCGGHCGGLGAAAWADHVFDWIDETVS